MSTKIWHDSYTENWMRAFPLGNGRIGAMVYGGPEKEIIEINEESLWSGRQMEERYHASPEALAAPWFSQADMSKYMAFVIATLNHDQSISYLLDPWKRIEKLLTKYRDEHK